MSRDRIGPSLPSQHRKDEVSSSDSEDSRGIGPRMPSNVIGPSMPQGLGKTSTTKEGDNSDSDDGNCGGIGPRLPSNLASNKDKDYSIGPSLPPSLKNAAVASTVTERAENYDSDSDEGFMGPALPPGFKIQPSVIGPALPPSDTKVNKRDYSDDDSYDTVGPLPSEMDRGGRSNIAEEFEKRARNMKDKLTKPEDAPLVLESWMTELPPEMGTNFGLSARKFRSKPSTKGEDRSGWTDTPEDKARKEKDKGRGKSKGDVTPLDPVLSARDRKIAEEVDKYNKNKRKETLLDMHQTERKKIKKEEAKNSTEEENVRRPFDRDQDLQVNRFDDAMRKSVIKKSQNLNTRFSHGSNSQFL